MLKCIGQKLQDKPKNYPGFWLSVSKVKVFKTCPAQYRFNYIEKLPKKEREYHVFGKFVHEVLENFHAAKINGSKLDDAQIMNEAFGSAVKSYDKLTEKQKQETFEILCKYLDLLQKGNDHKQKLSSNVVGVEEDFWIDIDNKVLLRGFIDRTQIDPDGVLHLADYKTAKRKDYLEKDYFQLLVYAYVKCLEDPTIEKIRCSYIMVRLNFDYITKEFTREDIMKVEKMLLDHAETIQAEKLFRPETSPLCAFCDFEEFCPEGQIAAEKYREKKKKREAFEKQTARWGREPWRK